MDEWVREPVDDDNVVSEGRLSNDSNDSREGRKFGDR